MELEGSYGFIAVLGSELGSVYGSRDATRWNGGCTRCGGCMFTQISLILEEVVVEI